MDLLNVQIPNLIERIEARIWYTRHFSELKKARDTTNLYEFFSAIVGPSRFDEMPPVSDFPGIKEHIQQCKEQIRRIPTGTILNVIGFGDSILAFGKHQIDAVPRHLNFAKGGMSSLHILETYLAVRKEMHKRRIVAKSIVVGCLIGNALLQFQNYGNAMADAFGTLDAIEDMEALYGVTPQICLYGVPPVYNHYAMSYAIYRMGVAATEPGLFKFQENGRLSRFVSKVIIDKRRRASNFARPATIQLRT